MCRLMLAVAAIALMCASGAPAGFAQSKKAEKNSRSVQGTVTTPEDVPVNGAVVQIKNTKSLQIRSFFTQENGTYYFHGLNPDVDYELKATYQDLASGTKTLSSFDSRKDAIINLKLNKK